MELGEGYMSKLICPICGAFTSVEPVEVGASVKIKTHLGWRNEHGTASAVIHDKDGRASYAILDCQACGGRFVGKADRGMDEWSAVYPIAGKRVDTNIDEPMKGEFEEANVCFAVGAYRGCASMCVTALEAMWRDQKASGLRELKERGIISQRLYEKANEVRLWGDIAKHEFVADVVEKEDAEELLVYLETILNDVYVEPRRLSRLAEKRKELGKKG
jgi:hypothetical protein